MYSISNTEPCRVIARRSIPRGGSQVEAWEEDREVRKTRHGVSVVWTIIRKEPGCWCVTRSDEE